MSNIRPKRIIRTLMIMFGVLIMAIIINQAFLFHQLNSHLNDNMSRNVQSRLNLALALHKNQVEEVRIVSNIVREQSQKFCDFLDYDNVGALTSMIKTMATIYDIDIVLLYNERGTIVTSYPGGPVFADPKDYSGFLNIRSGWNGVAVINQAVFRDQYPDRNTQMSDQGILGFHSNVLLLHDTGDISGQVVLLRLIPDNNKLVGNISRLANVEVTYFDASRQAVVSSFKDFNVSFPVRESLLINDRKYLTAQMPIPDDMGLTIGYLSAALDKGPFLLQRRQVLFSATVPMFLAALTFGVIFCLLKSRVFTKVDTLSQALRRVTQGKADFSIRIPEPQVKEGIQADEVQTMIADFNRMMTKLEDTYQQMLLARKAAEAATLAKSEFLANMSHEIRTPLNGVIGLLEVLKTTPLDPDQAKHTQMAIDAANRLTRLLSDILDLSRVEAGKMEIHAAEFSLKELSDSIEGLFAVSAFDKGISLECRVDPAMPMRLLGDEARVRQILFNLVGNALKYSCKGSISVEMVPLSPSRNENLRVLFSIRDTGIGIPENRLGDIFEPFRQVDGSYARKYQGAGLGLAIVRRLVDLMNGVITIESIPDKGTEVHVVLPFSLPSGGKLQEQLPQKQEGACLGLHILLVEDDPTNQYAIRMILKSMGHETTLAEDGEKALELMTDHHFDCILMDIQMPNMSGMEATKNIRGNDCFGPKKDIPIIALTAHTMTGDREKFLEAGMDDYLPKPVQLSELKRVLSKIRRENKC